MERQVIRDRIIKILEEQVILRSLTYNSDIIPLDESGIGLDSLCFLKLLSTIEKELNIKIDDDYWDYFMFKTLEDIIEYCYKSLNY